jgi:hypothetical protein
MTRQASKLWKRLRGFLTADLGRFAGGSAVSDPLGLLGVERERVAALRPRQPDGSAQAAPTAGQGTQPGACRNVTGRTEREPGGINLKAGASPTCSATASGRQARARLGLRVACWPRRARHDIRRLRQDGQRQQPHRAAQCGWRHADRSHGFRLDGRFPRRQRDQGGGAGDRTQPGRERHRAAMNRDELSPHGGHQRACRQSAGHPACPACGQQRYGPRPGEHPGRPNWLNVRSGSVAGPPPRPSCPT